MNLTGCYPGSVLCAGCMFGVQQTRSIVSLLHRVETGVVRERLLDAFTTAKRLANEKSEIWTYRLESQAF